MSDRWHARACVAVRDANTKVYASGRVVDSYLMSAYHELRHTLCRGLLLTELEQAFPARSVSDLRVLELGASSGHLSRSLVEAGVKLVTTDIDDTALRWAHDVGLPAACLDAASALPFADQSFHAIVMAELIEHIFDVPALLQESRRVLEPGGVLVITTPNLATLQDRIRFLFGFAPRQINPLHDYLYLHIRPFTVKSLARTLTWAGFGRLRVRSNFVVFRNGDRKLVESRFLARVFPGLGGSLIVAARKVPIAAAP